jgi:hypothetical protein
VCGCRWNWGKQSWAEADPFDICVACAAKEGIDKQAAVQTRAADDIRRELHKAQDERDQLWWTFTRTANGKPPSVVNPGVYRRMAALEDELRDAMRATS